MRVKIEERRLRVCGKETASASQSTPNPQRGRYIGCVRAAWSRLSGDTESNEHRNVEIVSWQERVKAERNFRFLNLVTIWEIGEGLRTNSVLCYHPFAGWSSLVARRAHNPEVVGSNPTPATKIIDSQGLAEQLQQALPAFGKDLGKKSVFPYRSQAIRFRKIHPISPPRLAHLA